MALLSCIIELYGALEAIFEVIEIDFQIHLKAEVNDVIRKKISGTGSSSSSLSSGSGGKSGDKSLVSYRPPDPAWEENEARLVALLKAKHDRVMADPDAFDEEVGINLYHHDYITLIYYTHILYSYIILNIIINILLCYLSICNIILYNLSIHLSIYLFIFLLNYLFIHHTFIGDSAL
jgi:hypothetical protein